MHVEIFESGKKVQIQKYPDTCVRGFSILTLGTRGFSRVRREFSKAARGHYKDLTETGNALEKSVAPRVQCTEHYKYIHIHHHRHLQKI